MTELLKMAKLILHEAENNPTVDKTWVNGMKISVDYLITRVENLLLSKFIEKECVDFDDGAWEKFCGKFCYDVNGLAEKRIARLDEIRLEI